MRDAMDKPLAFLWTGSLTATDGLNKLKEAKIPVFLSPDRLARGLRSKINAQRWRERLLKGADEPLQPASVWQQEALQELSKGKLTTLPKGHTGEGIFFTSKVADRFELESGRTRWLVDNVREDVAVGQVPFRRGTRG